MKKLTISLLVFFSTFFVMNAQTITGTWRTFDEDSGKAKSEVKIFIKDGKAYGNIIKLFKEKGEDPDPICTHGDDYRNGKKVIGMQIITGLKKDGDEWEGDDAIFDPENGKTYDCKIWLDEDNKDLLQVRGYIGFFFRTQTWKRVK